MIYNEYDIGPRAYHGTATVGGMIYIVGGFDGMDYFNSVRSYNPVRKEWSEVAPMNARRSVSRCHSNKYREGCGCLDIEDRRRVL